MEKMIRECIINAEWIEWRNSMGISESFYNPCYLLKSYLNDMEKSVDDFTDEQLDIMLDIARYAWDCFY